jgi:hypothetical protein
VEELATVYEFEIYDPSTRRWERSDRRGTVEAIVLLGGVPIRRTALPVDPARLDQAGFVRAGR